MAVNTEPVFVDSALTVAANTQIGNTIVNADGTTKKDIVNGATDGSLIQDLNVVSDDTATVDLEVYFYDGTTSWLLGTIQVAIEAGTVIGTPAASLLNVTDIPSLNKRDDGAILLATGQKLQVAAVSAVTAAKTVTITALGGNI